MTSPRWLGLGLAVLLVVGLASCTEVPENLDTTAPSASATLSGGPPKTPGYQCRYAIRWIDIKSAWRLAVDPSEVRALREMLGYC